MTDAHAPTRRPPPGATAPRPTDGAVVARPTFVAPPSAGIASTLRQAVAGALLGFTVSACAASGGSGVAPPGPASRSGDGLLERQDLQALVELQVERSGGELRSRLDDPDPAIRARAAFALASVQDPGSIEALIGSLDDPDPDVRADAAFAVGVTAGGESDPDPETAGTLLSALDREVDLDVRGALMEAVARTGGEDELGALLARNPPETDPAHAGAAGLARAVVRFGIRGIHSRDAVGWLAEAIRAPDPGVRVEAAYYFGRVPQPRFWQDRAPLVREALDGYAADDPAAMHLLGGLGTLADPLDRERIVQWLSSSPDWRTRTAAAQSLTAWRTDESVRDALFTALEDPSTHVAVSAAQALTTNVQLSDGQLDRIQGWLLSNPARWRVARPLLEALGAAGRGDVLLSWMDLWPEDAGTERGIALQAMAYVADDRIEPILFDAVGSDRPAIAAGAVTALSRRWRIMRGDPEIHEAYFDAFVSALASGGHAAAIEATLVLNDPVFQEMGAAEAMVERARSMTLPRDQDAYMAILGALGFAGDSGAPVEPLLRDALESDIAGVREAAARSLTALTGSPVEAPGDGGRSVVPVDWDRLAELGPYPRMVLETDEGRIVLALDAAEAPQTVSTLAGYASEGSYDGVPFHRVIPNFVVQGGDFVRGDGTGSPDRTIRTEVTRLPFDAWVIGMASSGRDTEGSQFYITHSKQAHLEGAYTSFGWVLAGRDVVGRIDEGEILRRMTVEPDPR